MSNDGDLEFAGITDPGLVRAQNEDAIVLDAVRGLAILADGMGGYNAGEVASSMATTVTRDLLAQALDKSPATDALLPSRVLHQHVVEAIQIANRAILEAARASPDCHGMGTTIVAAIFGKDRVTIAHVGDSRAYRFRGGALSQLTKDHSLLQEQIDAGLIDASMARFALNKNLVTRAVGVGADMDVEVHDHPLQPGDIYLLCSDGLTDMLSDDAIAKALAQEQGSLEEVGRALVRQANECGGLDNISVVLVRVRHGSGRATGLLGRILNWVS